MDPQQIPTTPTTGNLDPQAQNLAKAIRIAEGTDQNGQVNFSAQGKSGEYGAYQWLPQTWQIMSKNVGVNTPLDQATPEQQNEVAYKQIEIWKNEDKTPGQIASLWNSGDPNAYLGTFANGEPSVGDNNGIAYNVPSYAEKVANAYQSLKGKSNAPAPQPVTQTTPSSSPSFLTILEGLGLGGLSWLGGHLATAAKVGLPLAGGAIGTAIEPGAGTAIGGALGEEAANLIGGGNQQPPTDNTNVATPNAPQAPLPQTAPVTKETPISDTEEAANASNTLKEAITEMMQGTQPNRTFSQDSAGKEAINTAATFNLLSPDENGNMVFDEAKRQKLEGDLEKLEDGVIASEGGVGSVSGASNYANQFIGSDKFTTPLDKQQAMAHVEREIKARGVPENDQMSLSDMRTAQKQHYATAKGGYRGGKTSAEVLAHKALGHAYGQAILENTKNKELLIRARKMSRNLTRVKDLGKRLNGKKAPKHEGLWKGLAHSGARFAAVYIGDKIGGPIGAILGDMVGIHLTKAINKRFGQSIFETPSMRRAMATLEKESPPAYRILLEELKKNGVKAPNEKGVKSMTVPELQKLTSPLVNIPKRKLALSGLKPQGKARGGLIRPPKKRPKNQRGKVS